MTQKELLYVEDAIGHEQNILGIINYMTTNMQDKDLINFSKAEEKKHTKLLDNLMNLLKENTNE